MKTKLKTRLIHLMQHFLFWVVSFYVLLQVMDQDGDTNVLDVIYTFVFHIHLVILVSLNTLFLIPKHLEKGEYWAYGMTTLANIGFGFFLYRFSFDPLSDWLFGDYYFVAVYDWYETIAIIIAYLLLSTMLVLSKSWFKALALQKENAELKELSTSNELKMLRAQISPHFLFNSLNTIYGQSLKKDPKTPESILSLSGILRYNLESGSEEMADLHDEIKYVKEYISLQRARLDYPEQLRFDVIGEVKDQRVPTLMIIELLENALKHGNIQSEGAFIDLKLRCSESEISITCLNSIDQAQEKSKHSVGVGLENITKRLELSFPDKHRFITEQKNHEFFAEVTLNYA